MFFYRLILLFLICLGLSSAGIAKTRVPLELKFPVSCHPEQDCWFVNYPDLDFTQGFQDYSGGSFTQNGQKGIEIVVKSIIEAQNGVSVRAAEDGEVVSVKNNYRDNFGLDEKKSPSLCGNHVLLEHNEGWKTLYCGLKKDSITVKPGDFASEGMEIGEIGLSGSAEYPRLLFLVMQKGDYFDPFTGINLRKGSDEQDLSPLWSVNTRRTFKYTEISLVNNGVSKEKPVLNNIKLEDYEKVEIEHDTPVFYIWAHGFHLQKGDLLKIQLENPKNEQVFEEVKEIQENNLEQVVSFEIDKGEEDWEIGQYRAKIMFVRPSKKVGYKHELTFDIKKSQAAIDAELAEKERLKKLIRLKKRKIKLFKYLKDNDKLPDTYTGKY